MFRRRVTLKDIAARCDVSTVAVSLALRNHRSISEETKAKIRAMAEELRYSPDPALAALSHYRNQKRKASSGLTLAYLTYFPTPSVWRKDPFFELTHTGAEQRARSLGYRLEHFWAGEPGLSGDRLAQIFLTRGIRGALVSPFPYPGAQLTLPLENLSVVAIGLSLSAPVLHHACTNHYEQMLLLLSEVRRLGYRRPGLVLDSGVAHRVLGKYQAAHSMDALQNSARADRVPPLLQDQPSQPALRDWLRRYKPDLVVHHDEHLLPRLRALGWKVPGDVGFACLNCRIDSDVAGIDIAPDAIAAAAVDRVNLMLHDNEVGVPERPMAHEVAGLWRPGRTAPAKRS